MKKIFFALSILILASSACAQNEGFYTLSGKEITLEKVTTSPKTVLFLWATWCPNCRKEITRLNDDFPSPAQDTDFYYVSIGESRSTVQEFVKKINLTANVTEGILLDPDGILAQRYSVIGIPTFVVLKNGKVVYREHTLNQETLNNL